MEDEGNSIMGEIIEGGIIEETLIHYIERKYNREKKGETLEIIE